MLADREACGKSEIAYENDCDTDRDDLRDIAAVD